MASSSGKRTSSSNKRGSNSRSNNSRNSTSARRSKAEAYQAERDSELFHEIGLIVLFVAMVILFCCNFGLIGSVGDYISGVLFGLFGFTAYIAPVLIFLAVAFWFANEGNPTALRKMISGIVLFLMVGVVCDLAAKNATGMEKYSAKLIYENCRNGKMGGGVVAGSLAFLLHHYLETIGTVLVVMLFSVICVILLTEKSLIGSMKAGGSRIREQSRVSAERRREYNETRRLEQEQIRARREEERRLRAEEKENEKILRMEKKVTGVMMDTSLKSPEEDHHRDDIHEITFSGDMMEETEKSGGDEPGFDFNRIQIRSVHQLNIEENIDDNIEEEQSAQNIPWKEPEKPLSPQAQQIRIHKEGVPENVQEMPRAASRRTSAADVTEHTASEQDIHRDIQNAGKQLPKKYRFPSLTLLQRGSVSTGDSTRELKDTAMRLQQTLNTFGVKVSITDISQGPSVTRYELQPEQGVKVSKIVNLADDIKLNLAATDIRIEAPIPGKAAIGIEVPNKENMTVALRDLLENKEFKDFQSNIAFAVGKDICGKVVVTDIAKMPHVLIAGATGSGKSVCINTLIMSILYKAHPDDVKLIMIDPKVVELSVYNGIPHLLIPVVTDPKKASAALHWGVSEMEDRYRRFADYNVRDLKGYNKKVEGMRENGDESAPSKMPQIVIIVDELADLMMVCPGEVEESICRLAQLARAAGIHLVIATQRPSVDVITGLIKANMPSRIAFSVSSGVDSRTILDMNGAEKLLGKGDMLFYPQGYSKPARIQGAFVSDKEVSDVVDFLKNQAIGNIYAEDVEEKIKNLGASGSVGGAAGGNERDEYFEDAARFIIDKDKASIGMLQRVLKIGFNRAARIMDQLCEYGVVGEEEGTKPRKVLMSMEQFEQLMEEI